MSTHSYGSTRTATWIDAVDAAAEAMLAIAGKAARVAMRLGTRHKRRRMIAELQGLSDHALRDIGVSRSMIPYAVEQRLTGGGDHR